MSIYPVSRGEGSTPLYRQIRDALASEIKKHFSSGDGLPSEGELAKRFGVNRHTLRRAIDELVADGLVQRIHGRGVFVIEPSINYYLGKSTRFTKTLESLGRTTDSHVLRKLVIPATKKVAAKLKRGEGEEVIFIETLRNVEARPFCIISHFIPLTLCPEILDHYSKNSLHEFINKECGIQLKRSESLISAILPDADDAALLNMPRHEPVLQVKSTNLDIKSNKPVEYAITRFRGDATQLSFSTLNENCHN